MASWKKIITSGSQADLAAVSASAGIVGTLQTAAQTNITSLGTLSSIDVDGGAIDGTTIGANSSAAGTFTNLTSLLGITASKFGSTDDDNLITLSNNTVTIGSGDTLKVNTIAESDSTVGVTIDGLLIKDGNISSSNSTLTLGPLGDSDVVSLTANTASINGHVTATSFKGDGSELTGIATTIQLTGSNASNDTVDLKTSGVTFSSGSGAAGDINFAVASDTVTTTLSSAITGVTTIKNDDLILQRNTNNNDQIRFAANDIQVKVGGSEVASFEDNKVVISQALSGSGLDLTANAGVGGNLQVDGTTTVTGNATFNGNITGDGATDLTGIDNLGVVNISASAGAAILGTERTDASGRAIGLFVENDVSASGFQGEFFSITSSIIITSESTEFGNSEDDVHIFSGSLDITQNVTMSANLSGSLISSASFGYFSGSFQGSGKDLDLSENSTIGSNIFATVTTTGGGNVVAEANNDTLALSSSDGIVVSGSVDEDKINFGLSNVPNSALANDGITIAGVDTSLGGTITQAKILEASSVVSASATGTSQGQLKFNGVDVNVKDLGTDADVTFDTLTLDSGGLLGVGAISSSVLSVGTQGRVTHTQNGSATNHDITNLGTTGTPTFATVTLNSGGLLGVGAISSSAITSTTQGQVTLTNNGSGSNTNITGLTTGDSPTFQNLTLNGDLTVTGKTTQVNLEQIQLADNFILLNSGSNTSTDVDSGITIKENDTSFRSFYFDAQVDRFAVNTSTTQIATDGAIAGKDYVMTVSSSVGAPTGTGNYGTSDNRKGQVVVDDDGNIWMYVD